MLCGGGAISYPREICDFYLIFLLILLAPKQEMPGKRRCLFDNFRFDI